MACRRQRHPHADLESRKGDDDQWLFLPAIKRVKRISSRNKSGSFMGSEFSYEDLGSTEVEKYTHKFLGDEKLQRDATFGSNNRSQPTSALVTANKSSGWTRNT